jgi:hypothetical protein
VDDKPFLTWMADHVIAGYLLLIGAFVGMVRWIYVRDAEKINASLAEMKKGHESLVVVVGEINATRPLRSEMVEAIEGLREETEAGFRGLRSELRDDIGGLRHDMTTRLDTLIKLQTQK